MADDWTPVEDWQPVEPAAPAEVPSPYQAALERWNATYKQRTGGFTRPFMTEREKGRADALERGGGGAAVLYGLNTGTTGNLTDYPKAIGAGVEGLVTGKGFSGPYSDTIERERGIAEGLAEKYPGTTLGSDITGAVATGIGPSGLIRGGTTLIRMLKAALVGGGVGAYQGAAREEGAANRAQAAATGGAIGAAIGGAAEPAVSGLGALGQRYFGAATRPGPGIDPTQRITEAEAFGIPLTRGQATGNLGQQAYEEAARNQARGQFAGHAVRSFDERQAAAIRAAQDQVSTQLGGAPRTVAESGDAVSAALKGEAQAARTAANRAYGAAEGKQAWISSDDVGQLGRSVGQELEAGGIRLDTYGNYPGSQAAMNLLRRVAGFEGAPGGGQVVAQSLQGIEQARKALIKVKPGNAEDARALGAIKRSFDGWLDDAIDRRLFSGDPTAIDDLKQARALWARYKGLTAGEGQAPKLVSKIINEQRTGDEVANWLLGTAGAQQTGQSARLATEVRNILGASSQEWEALRQAAWTKIVNPTRGQGGPQAVSTSINDFVSGQGKPLASVLFTAPERDTMKKLAGVIRTTVTDPRATNPSKTSYGMARLLGAGGIGVGGGGAYWMTGDPHYLAIAAAPLIKGTSGLSKGFAATRSTPSSLAVGTGQASRAGAMGGAAAGGRQSAGFPAIQAGGIGRAEDE